VKTYYSPTANGGKTIVLESLSEAVALARDSLAQEIRKNARREPQSKLKVVGFPRDEKRFEDVITNEAYGLRLQDRFTEFEECVKSISLGNPNLNQTINDTVDSLSDLVCEIEPSLRGSYDSFERSDDGIEVSADLLAAGDDMPFFRRRLSQNADGSSSSRAEGYRIVLSTDTAWFGKPEDNAAVISALILCLQRFGPVELWIQQGWLGAGSGDGVTLFKLDFKSSFDPSQIIFWCADRLKDTCFSFEVNMGLGRHSGKTAKHPEIPADLFLRGDWMRTFGVNENFPLLLHTEKLDVMAKWVAATAFRIVSSTNPEDATFSINPRNQR
jgi:hypothetical protein